MPNLASRFESGSVAWRRVTDPDCTAFKVDYEYVLLGYDLALGRLDMVLRYAKGRGHCRRHRHIASTMTLVLEGEQHLIELQPDGSTKAVSRKAGDYALSSPDALPHIECGGEDGGTVILSMTAPDGVLFEYFDETMTDRWTLSIEQFVESWTSGVVHGTKPELAAA